MSPWEWVQRRFIEYNRIVAYYDDEIFVSYLSVIPLFRVVLSFLEKWELNCSDLKL